MKRTRMGVLVGLAALTVMLAGCGGSDDGTTAADTEPAPVDSGTVLAGSVGPGFEIDLSADGAEVTRAAPGTYTVEVDDQASSHNFHLSGPGVDEATEVGETGTATWEVTLEPGTYTFVCDPHAGSMNGSFEVSG